MKRSPLHPSRPPDRSDEPGYREWKAPSFGRCAVCGTPGLLLRHHVVLEQHVRRIDPARAWDLANALLVGYEHCSCHRRHHSAIQRVSLTRVPDEAIAFASELLGSGAGAYLSRYYAP